MMTMGKLRTPSATLRLATATRYWHSARIVIKSQVRQAEFMEPVGHLLAMAVELTLKAFLLDTGMTNKELGQRNVGHDLGSILRKSVENGLRISEQDAVCILTMRQAHLEHFHRYGPNDLSAGAFCILLVDEMRALETIARLIDLIGGDPNGLRVLYQHTKELEWPATELPTAPIDTKFLVELITDIENQALKVENFGVKHR